MQVLGYSHKGDRWTVKMGLAAASEKEMFIKHSAATHTPSETLVVQSRSVYHVWRKKVNKVTQLRKRRRAEGRVSDVKMTF